MNKNTNTNTHHEPVIRQTSNISIFAKRNIGWLMNYIELNRLSV